MPLKIRSAESRVKLPEAQPIIRSGGEKRPFQYPHLYQIQAGDWRISYAVEHNRLAILVLEVLTPEGIVRKDMAAEKMKRKMKVKLLDWPEGGPSPDLPPEELGKKMKIKFLDLAGEMAADDPESPRSGKDNIKISSASSRTASKQRISVRPSARASSSAEPVNEDNPGEEEGANSKVASLKSPTVE